MKYKDLSLKAKFDAAVMGVLRGNPSKIISDEYKLGNEIAHLEFEETSIAGMYKGALRIRHNVKSYLGGSVNKVADKEVMHYGPQMVRIEDVPEIIEDWQRNMRDADWIRVNATRFGLGAEYQAVMYKKDITLG